jgi:hypothetical protein
VHVNLYLAREAPRENWIGAGIQIVAHALYSIPGQVYEDKHLVPGARV